MTPTKDEITRAEAAVLLGRGKEAVLFYHGKGLTPRKNERGEWLYKVAEVERLGAILATRGKKKTRGPLSLGGLASVVYRHFDAGTPLAEIVQKCRIEPEKLLAWHAIYLQGFDRLPTALTPEQELARANLELKKQREHSRVELERERLYFAEQRRRDRQ